MRVLIIGNYTIVPGEKGNCRLTYLANLFAEEGHQVTLMTSSFAHRTKTFRNEENINKLIKHNYRINLINELGYIKHLGIKRIVSHYQFGVNLSKALVELKEIPDAIYFSFPTFSSAQIAVNYAKLHNIPSVVDIIDIWPEALKSVVRLPDFLFNFLVLPFTIKANKIYKDASAIVGVSNTYVDRAKKVNRSVPSLPVFLGTDLSIFDKLEISNIKKGNEIWLIYIGLISYSYDIKTVLEALKKIINEHNISQIKLKILGSGPHKGALEEFARVNKLPVDFLGFMEYSKMVNYLKNSDIALSAIVKGAQQSITYKIGDYVSAGLPILNSSENEEFRNLIESEELGLNYTAGDSEDLTHKILELINDKNKLSKYGINSRKIAVGKFNRRITNIKIVRLVEKLVTR